MNASLARAANWLAADPWRVFKLIALCVIAPSWIERIL